MASRFFSVDEELDRCASQSSRNKSRFSFACGKRALCSDVVSFLVPVPPSPAVPLEPGPSQADIIARMQRMQIKTQRQQIHIVWGYTSSSFVEGGPSFLAQIVAGKSPGAQIVVIGNCEYASASSKVLVLDAAKHWSEAKLRDVAERWISLDAEVHLYLTDEIFAGCGPLRGPMTVDTIQLRRNPQCVYSNDLFEWASKAGLSQVVPSHCLDQAKMEAGDLNSHPTNVVPLFMAGVPAQIRPSSPRGPRCSPECIEIDDDDDDGPAMHWEYDDDAEY